MHLFALNPRQTNSIRLNPKDMCCTDVSFALLDCVASHVKHALCAARWARPICKHNIAVSDVIGDRCVAWDCSGLNQIASEVIGLDWLPFV